MLASFLHFTEHAFGAGLGPFAGRFHAAVLGLLVLAWIAPPAAFLWRRWRARRYSSLLSFWECRSCRRANPSETILCQKCGTPMDRPWWDSWAGSRGGRRVRAALRWAGLLWRAAGWAVFYTATVGLARGLRFLSFEQAALQELFASAAAALALAALFLAGRALGRSGGSPLARAMDLAAAGALSGFLALAGVLWAAAPFPPQAPLAEVLVSPDGRVRLSAGGTLRAEAMGDVEGGAVRFRLECAVLSWPLFHLDQAFVTRLGGWPASPEWTLRLFDRGARSLARDDPYRPRMVLLEQSFSARPGGPHRVRRALDGRGWVLEEAP